MKQNNEGQAPENEKVEKAKKTMAKAMQILEDNYGSSAMIPRPATKGDITRCNKDLTDLGLELLPEDYVAFLKVCNGFAWNGVELYGTYQVSDPASSAGYILMDIVTMSDYGDDRYYDSIKTECLYFGRADEDVYTWNAATKKYEVRDLSCISDVMEEYDTMVEFFASVVGGRLGLGGR
jgi:hypothetical protein